MQLMENSQKTLEIFETVQKFKIGVSQAKSSDRLKPFMKGTLKEIWDHFTALETSYLKSGLELDGGYPSQNIMEVENESRTMFSSQNIRSIPKIKQEIVLLELYQNTELQKKFWERVNMIKSLDFNLVTSSTRAGSPIIIVLESQDARTFDDETIKKIKALDNSIPQRVLFLLNTGFDTIRPPNSKFDMKACDKGEMQCDYLSHYHTSWKSNFEEKLKNFLSSFVQSINSSFSSGK